MLSYSSLLRNQLLLLNAILQFRVVPRVVATRCKPEPVTRDMRSLPVRAASWRLDFATNVL